MYQSYAPEINRNSWFGKSCVYTINRNGVEWVCRVATDIHNYRQPSILAGSDNLVFAQERWDKRRQVDAIYKDIHIKDFLEWTTFGSLSHIPL